jgi:hypothetical protein
MNQFPSAPAWNARSARLTIWVMCPPETTKCADVKLAGFWNQLTVP